MSGRFYFGSPTSENSIAYRPVPEKIKERPGKCRNALYLRSFFRSFFRPVNFNAFF